MLAFNVDDEQEKVDYCHEDAHLVSQRMCRSGADATITATKTTKRFSALVVAATGS